MKICPMCNREYNDEECFCREDGTLLVDKVVEEHRDDVAFCPACGAKRREGKNFCTSCGYDFVNKKENNKQNNRKHSSFTPEKSRIIIGIYSIIFSIFAIGFCFADWLTYDLKEAMNYFGNGGIIDFIRIATSNNPESFTFLVGLVGFISLLILLISAFINLGITIFSFGNDNLNKTVKKSLFVLMFEVFILNYFLAFGVETGGFLGFLSLIGIYYIYLDKNILFSYNSSNSSDKTFKILSTILFFFSALILLVSNPIAQQVNNGGSLYSYHNISGIFGFVYLISYTGDFNYLVNLAFYLIYITLYVIFVYLMSKNDHLKAGVTAFAFSIIDILFIITVSFVGLANTNYLPNLIASLIFVLAIGSLSVVLRAKFKDKYID